MNPIKVKQSNHFKYDIGLRYRKQILLKAVMSVSYTTAGDTCNDQAEFYLKTYDTEAYVHNIPDNSTISLMLSEDKLIDL